MSAVERIQHVARLAGRPLGTNPADASVARRAARLLDEGLLPLSAINEAHYQALLEEGYSRREAQTLADALSIGTEVPPLEHQIVIERYDCPGGSIEILAPERRVDQVLRDLLAEASLSPSSARRVTRAIGITDDEHNAALKRLGVTEFRNHQTGRLQLAALGGAPTISDDPIACGHPHMWRATRGPWRCTICHPPALPELVAERAPIVTDRPPSCDKGIWTRSRRAGIVNPSSLSPDAA